jgi:hypothetical protein
MYLKNILGWMSVLLYAAAAHAQNQYEIDQQVVRGVDPGFLVEAADRLLGDSGDFVPRLTRTPNGIGADMAFPVILERNYLTECIRHLSAAKAFENEVVRFSRELNLPPPPTTFEFRNIQNQILKGFEQDQFAFSQNNIPNIDRLNSYANRNTSNFDRCARDMANARRLPFLGYRNRPLPNGMGDAPREYVRDSPTMATRSDQITMTTPQGVRTVEFVTQLERMLNEHRRIPQDRWQWQATTLDSAGRPEATLTIGAAYFFRLDRNPSKCHSILVSSRSLRFPAS